VIAHALQSDALISGSADTLLAQHYDINAKVDDQQETAMAKLSCDERRGQTALMLQSLLADRFNLKVHWQKRELPVYALAVAKDGPKFKPFAPQPTAAVASPQQTPLSMGQVGFSLTVNSDGAKLAATGEPIDALARMLASQKGVEGRSVIDRTGLDGKYDYTMHWTTEQNSQTPKAGDNGLSQPVGGDGPSLFTALQDQLGLKLRAEKQLWLTTWNGLQKTKHPRRKRIGAPRLSVPTAAHAEIDAKWAYP
jgi:bla regulator protein BlaR1